MPSARLLRHLAGAAAASALVMLPSLAFAQPCPAGRFLLLTNGKIFDFTDPPRSMLVPTPKCIDPMMFLSSRWMPRMTAFALTPTDASAGHI